MTWFKVDDQLAFHRKARAAGNAAMGLWVRAGSYCGAQLSDGHVDADVIPLLGGKAADVARLVKARLWHGNGHDCEACPQPNDMDGYVFHDWEAHQPMRSKVEERRAEDRERKAAARAEKDRKSKAQLKAVSE